MRIFQTFKEMYSEVWRDVAELGVRVKSHSVQNIQDVGSEYEMKEIIGYSYELTDTKPVDILTLNHFTKEEIDWASAEFGERINPMAINPGKAWHLRAEIWRQFLNLRQNFDYTYNERMRYQLPRIIDELKRHPRTRQAVLTIFNASNDIPFLGGVRRIPCSMHYQFFLRDMSLHMIYNMRSCDIATHFRFDVALACMLLDYVAYRVDKHPGNLIHNIGSLHCFKKDVEGVF